MSDDPVLQKADFDSIYDQRDPRAYFTTLEPFDYQVPQHGADIFNKLLQVRPPGSGRTPTVLDVCCSYGVAATLLKTSLDMGDLYAHYRDPAVQEFVPEQMMHADKSFLDEHRRPRVPKVLGLDVAGIAVDYALAIGSLDAGAVENLEEDEPTSGLAEQLSEVDLITTTGGIGYVTERTFDRLLTYAPASAWVATFCLRTYDYEPIIETLSRHGLRTERVERTFRQRRFTDETEQKWALEQVTSRGFDPEGREDDGYYHAEFYLSRPAAQVAERPLEQLLPELG